MSKLRKWIGVFLFVVFALLLAFMNLQVNLNAKADTSNEVDTQTERINDDSITPRAFATVTISIDGGNGKVWTTVKNEFTLFPSTVYVIVELYYSTSFTNDYHEMTLAASNTIVDLNMGSTLSAEASTCGEQRYWIGRVQFKENNGSWKEKVVGVAKFSATGEYLGLN